MNVKTGQEVAWRAHFFFFKENSEEHWYDRVRHLEILSLGIFFWPTPPLCQFRHPRWQENISIIVHTAKYACRREARFLKVNYLPGKVYLTLSNKWLVQPQIESNMTSSHWTMNLCHKLRTGGMVQKTVNQQKLTISAMNRPKSRIAGICNRKEMSHSTWAQWRPWSLK